MNIRPSEGPGHTPVILRHELIEQGYNDRALAQQVRRGVLAKPRRGAYVDGPTWESLDPPGRHALTARAVLRQAQTDLVLSHVSALGEYGVPAWNVDLSTVHVTRRDQKAGRKERGVQQHCGLLLPEDVVHRNGVPVTSATRLALDMTTLVGCEESLVVVNHLLNTKQTSGQSLADRYADMDHWPYTLRTDLVLRLADGRIESVGETRTWYLCWRQGLPTPEPQYKIRDASGRVVARVDFAWPELGVFLEFDGMVKYQRLRREGESAADVVVREKRREEMICELTGWRCIRITWADLLWPERTAARILRLLYPDSRAA